MPRPSFVRVPYEVEPTFVNLDYVRLFSYNSEGQTLTIVVDGGQRDDRWYTSTGPEAEEAFNLLVSGLASP